MRKTAAKPRDNAERIDIERLRIASHAALEPVVMELDAKHIEAIKAERMDVAVTDSRPVTKFNAEFVGGVRRPHEVALVDPKKGVKQVDLRDGGLADADRSNLIRFDQLDCQVCHFAEDLRHGCRRHPARGTAADDDNLANSVCLHSTTSCGRVAAFAAAQHCATNSSW